MQRSEVSLTALLSPTRPLLFGLNGQATQAGGQARWDEVEIPRRTGGIEYVGTSVRTLTIPGIFDALAPRFTRSGEVVQSQDPHVENAIATLERWADGTATTGEPPVLKVAGGVPHGKRRWVIDSIEWGDYQITRSDNNRSQQQFVLVLKEYHATAVALTERRTGTGARPATTIVRRSDFPVGLPRIASRTLGDARKWKQIAAKNRNRKGKVIRDPLDIYVGQELRYR